jgi:hypothetical protein
MNKVAVTAACLLICLTESFASAQAPTPPSNLATADWSVKQAKILNAEPNETVWKFMNSDGSNDVGLGELCEFHFADLHHSGELSLVISYDYGGTMGCNYVAIFEKTRAGIEKYDFDSGSNFSFDSIEDINGDGHDELVVDGDFASVGIDHCIATWPTIYAWTGNGYSDVSSRYKGYYRRILADLKRQISAPPPTAVPTPITDQAERAPLPMDMQTHENNAAGAPPQGVHGNFLAGEPAVLSMIVPTSAAPEPTPDSDLDCPKAQASKMERFLRISRDAGLTDAIKWAKSDDAADRNFAIDTLYDIGTPTAVKYLRMLSTDKDRNIAASARTALTARRSKVPAVNPTIHGEMFYPNTIPPRTK